MGDIFELLKAHPWIILLFPIVLCFVGGFAFYKILMVSIKHNREREKENIQHNRDREKEYQKLLTIEIRGVSNSSDAGADEIKYILGNINDNIITVKEGVKQLNIYRGGK